MSVEPSPCRCGNETIDEKATGRLTSYQCPACGISGPAMHNTYEARVAWNAMQERLNGWHKEEEQFWLVWNLEARNPRFRHNSQSAAEEEAKRLAAQNPGQAFYVAHIVSVARGSEVTMTTLAENIPF